MSSLLGFFQVAKMVWPGMGSEIAFELYEKNSGAYYVRVLWGGQPMETSTPLGTLNFVPINDFIAVSFLVYSCRGMSGSLTRECAIWLVYRFHGRF